MQLFGYLKNADKNEFIVQKAVELGVKKIGVFSSEFSSAYMNANKLERLNKVAKESAKQCLRATAPEILYFDSLEKALESAKAYKNKLFACEFATESKCDMDNLEGDTAIVIGSEGDGMSRLVRQNCDVTVHIPMKGRITSLNASAAASILLYEAVRQRG